MFTTLKKMPYAQAHVRDYSDIGRNMRVLQSYSTDVITVDNGIMTCSGLYSMTTSGVAGWDVEPLNKRIDEFNSYSWASEADFFQWLSWVEDDGNDYQGFSVLWNSKLMVEVHQIRK